MRVKSTPLGWNPSGNAQILDFRLKYQLPDSYPSLLAWTDGLADGRRKGKTVGRTDARTGGGMEGQKDI